MKYLPLILLLLFACKKESKENPQPQATPITPQCLIRECHSGYIADSIPVDSFSASIKYYYLNKVIRLTRTGHADIIINKQWNDPGIENMLQPYGIAYEVIDKMDTTWHGSQIPYKDAVLTTSDSSFTTVVFQYKHDSWPVDLYKDQARPFQCN